MQECANLTKEINGWPAGGQFWTFKASEGRCWVRKSNKGRRVQPGLVSGNRACGGLPISDWKNGNQISFYHITIPSLISSPGSICPTPVPPTPGQPCTLHGALDCHYEIDYSQCCTDDGAQHVKFSCVPDPWTEGAGLWKTSSLCPVKGCSEVPCRKLWDCGIEGESEMFQLEIVVAITGFATSQNFPRHYPFRRENTQTIHVESGKILRLEFTHFAVDWDSHGCSYDSVKITDGDGTTLMNKS